MKKIIILTAIITALTAGVCFADVDSFVFTDDIVAADAGDLQDVEIKAMEGAIQKNDYSGPGFFAYLSIPAGGEVIVDATGTSRTPDFTNGIWAGQISIRRAGANITVLAADSVTPSATGLSAAVNISTKPYTKLKMIVPNMVFAPGTAIGHTGASDLLTTQTDFGVTVYACDEWYNPKTPTTDTGIVIEKNFSGVGSYISVTPYCSASIRHNIKNTANSITFTVSVWPNPNKTKTYQILAKDYAPPALQDPLDIDFFSMTDYYYKTLAPLTVTAGVPFGVTVVVSHFSQPPKSETPDSTFIQSVDLKAINNSDFLDASPPFCNAELTPQPVPIRMPCVAGLAYYEVVYTKKTLIRAKPVPVGLTPVVNSTEATSYSPYITVGAAGPASFTMTPGANTLSRGDSTLVTVKPYDIFANPVTNTAVVFYVFDPLSNTTVTTTVINTDPFGEASLNFIAPAGNFENIIYASVAPISVSKSVTILSELTEKFENWPNPFKAGKEITKINYSLPVDSEVKLRLYSSFGKLVWSKDIKSGEVEAGEKHGKQGGNTVIWDGVGDKGFTIGVGVYILKMTIKNSSGTTTQTRKIAVVK